MTTHLVQLKRKVFFESMTKIQIKKDSYLAKELKLEQKNLIVPTLTPMF